MGISLRKGGNVSLSKAGGSSLNVITVGLGWDERVTDGADFDLDATAFCLGANGKVRNDGDFIFYNNLVGLGGAIEHTGDNRDGGSDGDDEEIIIKLKSIPSGVEKIAICVTIDEADSRNQNFGMVSNAFVRVVNNTNNQELAKYDLTEDMSMETAMIFAELYRYNGEWKFKAIGQGFNGGLFPLCQHFGVNVG